MALSNRFNVLIAYEGDEIGTALKKALEELGASVTLCPRDGEKVFACLEKDEYELAVFDVFMPTADGLEVLEKAKKQLVKKPLCVIVSGVDTALFEQQIPISLSRSMWRKRRNGSKVFGSGKARRSPAPALRTWTW